MLVGCSRLLSETSIIRGSEFFKCLNYGKLRFKTEYEQQLWQECSRLVTNCIIYYNAMLLSNVLDYKEAVGDIQGADLLKHISPIAWQHINLYGRYEFRKGPEAININELVRELA